MYCIYVCICVPFECEKTRVWSTTSLTLKGTPYMVFISQSFIALLKLIWGEYDIVAMNEWKKKCIGLQRTWVSKRTVVFLIKPTHQRVQSGLTRGQENARWPHACVHNKTLQHFFNGLNTPLLHSSHPILFFCPPLPYMALLCIVMLYYEVDKSIRCLRIYTPC